MLNMVGCGYIYLKKQSSEYARILNVSDAVRSRKSLYKLLRPTLKVTSATKLFFVVK